ncbi:MAG: Wadjet anti-phage system protein JetD domain-containing protein [Pseudomonadota bacterium]
MSNINWSEKLEFYANQLRGRRKSVEFIAILDCMLQEHSQWMMDDEAPEQLSSALVQLMSDGRWRAQPKNEKFWKRGWRGLMLPNKLIYQYRNKDVEVVVWHPWLAQKGAATRAKGKYRDKLIRLNQHLIRCEKMNEEPFPGDNLGQRERALRLFEDEKAIDNMPDSGWKSVPISREELRCVKKPPPIKAVYNPKGYKSPLILENVETFHRLVDINSSNPTWAYVIWGSGTQIVSQFEEISNLIQDYGFNQILYFGDLDAKGIEIVATLRRNLKNCGIEVKLEEHLYQIIIDSSLTTPEWSANIAGDFETDWIPRFIADNLNRLVETNKRIPQEAFINNSLEE